MKFTLRNLRRGIAGGLVVGVAVGIYQGKVLRDEYRRMPELEAPSGPRTGFEKFKHKLGQKVDEIITEDLPLSWLEGLGDNTRNRLSQALKLFQGKWQGLTKEIKESDKLSRLEERLEQFSDRASELLKDTTKGTIETVGKLKDTLAKRGSGAGQTGYGNTNRKPAVLHEGNQREVTEDDGVSSSSSSSISSGRSGPRRIKLLVLGDSLAVGIGCDEAHTGPVFPRVLAKILNKCLKADVSWHSVGVSGATVTEMRTLVPSLRNGFLKPAAEGSAGAGAGQGDRVICVIICGLNDWKAFFERYGQGPAGFRSELSALAAELTELGATDIFLPALPSMLLDSDPKFIMRVAPLRYVAQVIVYLWDLQKYNLAAEMAERIEREEQEGKVGGGADRKAGARGSMTFISTPTTDRAYATPGEGNVAKDGVHLSSQGYAWWAAWIAENILKKIDE